MKAGDLAGEMLEAVPQQHDMFAAKVKVHQLTEMHSISASNSLLGPTRVQDRAARHSGQLLQQLAWGFEDEEPALKMRLSKDDEDHIE